jgi:hypothetical protein
MSIVSERDQQQSTFRPSHFTDSSWAQIVFGDTQSRVTSSSEEDPAGTSALAPAYSRNTSEEASGLERNRAMPGHE